MTVPPALVRSRARALFRDLDSPREIVSNLTPNWFASVMGTGIVATATGTVPGVRSALAPAATAVWALAGVWLIVLTVATALHWRTFRATARGHHLHPVMAHFYGAPPMALLTVGAGAMLFGPAIWGTGPSTAVAWALWCAGTALGLLSAVAVPALAFTRIEISEDAAFGGWLMPVVPPMVSAATGALLVPTLPAGQPRLTMLLACDALFGMSLLSSFVIVVLIWGRLMRHKVGPAVMVPTLWIVLGPLGQSVTAANLLGAQAAGTVPAPLSTALEAFGVVFGVPVLGFALLWMSLAATLTVRALRDGMPFALTWWSFTFPVGTCATGAGTLATQTGSVAVAVLSWLLYAGLVAAWALVAVRTVHGAIVRGSLLRPPTPAG